MLHWINLHRHINNNEYNVWFQYQPLQCVHTGLPYKEIIKNCPNSPKSPQIKKVSVTRGVRCFSVRKQRCACGTVIGCMLGVRSGSLCGTRHDQRLLNLTHTHTHHTFSALFAQKLSKRSALCPSQRWREGEGGGGVEGGHRSKWLPSTVWVNRLCS